jgi:hypothetical protein
MLPIWDAVEALLMSSDTQIDTQKLVASGQELSARVPIKDDVPILLAPGDRPLVHQSPHLSEKGQEWQMVRDAGFEPATSCV